MYKIPEENVILRMFETFTEGDKVYLRTLSLYLFFKNQKLFKIITPKKNQFHTSFF
jgi:hypothetical protein